MLQLQLLHRRLLWPSPLHRLVQLEAREGQVTSRGSRHTILQPSREGGGGDPIVVDNCFRQVGKIMEAIEITFNATEINIATFQVKGESQV